MTDLVADRPWATRLLAEDLRQPDQRSCGAASLVVARALRDERYAEMLVAGRHPTTGWTLVGAPERRFASEVLAMHARVTGPVDVLGRLQLPWPTLLGTPPWAIAHQLSSRSLRWRSQLALTGLPVDAIRAALARGLPVPSYVGTRWSPRHVVLAVGSSNDGGLAVYDPAAGRVVTVPPDRLDQGSLPFGRWDHGWFVVLPEA